MMVVNDALLLLDKALSDTVEEEIVEVEEVTESGEVEVEVKKQIKGGVRLPKRTVCDKCGKNVNSLDPWNICLCKFEMEDLPEFKESLKFKSLIKETYKTEARAKKGIRTKPIVFGLGK